MTAEEYARLLDAIYVTVEASDAQQAKIHAFIQCMRWSGLAMLDALKLKRENLQHDTDKGIYRIVTNRTKTGTPCVRAYPEGRCTRVAGRVER